MLCSYILPKTHTSIVIVSLDVQKVCTLCWKKGKNKQKISRYYPRKWEQLFFRLRKLGDIEAFSLHCTVHSGENQIFLSYCKYFHCKKYNFSLCPNFQHNHAAFMPFSRSAVACPVEVQSIVFLLYSHCIYTVNIHSMS